jgi:uncharacterized protein YfaS (alpha-2-macroglobulin family)
VRSVNVPVRVDRVGQQTLTVRAFGQNVSDAVARSVSVVPDGVSVPAAHSGSLAAGSTTLTTSFPSNAVQGSGLMYLDIYPAFVSQAVQGLDSMLRVPNGCFEQTTSTTWPNVLVTRYMEQTKQSTPEIALKAETLISAGYQRLLTFEHRTGGFSWFGDQDPKADISVTAFGLMEFGDMAKVQEVDDAMLARTQTWLVGQQGSDGSWPGGMTEFFSFQTSASRNTAFVVWALAQSGYSGPALQSGLDYLRKQISSKDDAYTVALAANAFAAAAPNDAEISTLLDQLLAQKHDDAGKTSWDSGATQTNFYGGGLDSAVATTALVAHAFLTANQSPSVIKGALAYVTSAKDANGNFGSTQAGAERHGRCDRQSRRQRGWPGVRLARPRERPVGRGHAYGHGAARHERQPQRRAELRGHGRGQLQPGQRLQRALERHAAASGESAFAQHRVRPHESRGQRHRACHGQDRQPHERGPEHAVGHARTAARFRSAERGSRRLRREQPDLPLRADR